MGLDDGRIDPVWADSVVESITAAQQAMRVALGFGVLVQPALPLPHVCNLGVHLRRQNEQLCAMYSASQPASQPASILPMNGCNSDRITTGFVGNIKALASGHGPFLCVYKPQRSLAAQYLCSGSLQALCARHISQPGCPKEPCHSSSNSLLNRIFFGTPETAIRKSALLAPGHVCNCLLLAAVQATPQQKQDADAVS